MGKAFREQVFQQAVGRIEDAHKKLSLDGVFDVKSSVVGQLDFGPEVPSTRRPTPIPFKYPLRHTWQDVKLSPSSPSFAQPSEVEKSTSSTMSFSALPNELIYQIAQRVQPDDLDSFGHTSHRIKNVAAPFVKEHRQLKAQYSKISLGHVGAAKLVYEMCARPWLRLYPRSLELRANRQWRTLENPGTRAKAKEVEAITVTRSLAEEEDIRDVLRRTRLIPAHEVDKWLEEIERGDEDYLFALMLACLPNLERLIIRLDHTRLEQVKEMVRTIKRQPESSQHPRALSRLKDARVLEREGSNTCDLELFPLIASLPGIEFLHGRNLVGMYRECYRDGWLTYPGASPTITHITLETCGMSVEGLEKLCDSITGLRSFKYVAHRAGWGLHRISDLLKTAHTTLEELVLSTGSGESRFIGHLRKFTALKHVEVDSGMFMQRGKMQRAVDVLPASIETATLSGNTLTPALEEHFLADLYRPSFYYPKLRRLSVDDSWGKRDIGKDRLKFQKEFHKQSSASWTLRYR